MTRVTVLSFRLGTADGVSVAAAQWIAALRDIGCEVTTVAGSGVADARVPGLEIDSDRAPCPIQLSKAIDGADVVVVENVCSLPINPAATAGTVTVLRGRPAILRHHDLPWERPNFARAKGWPPRDPAWTHVAISEHSRRELARRGIEAVMVYPGYAAIPPPGDRVGARSAMDVTPGATVLLQPTRAIARKNVRAGIQLAERIDACYWLTGPAEDGYGGELATLVRSARCRLIRGLPASLGMADAYAAADAVVLPSDWEGFGLPAIESALLGKPLAIGDYPVARELAALGFHWFPTTTHRPLAAWLSDPDERVLRHNHALAMGHFGPPAVRRALSDLLSRVLAHAG